MTYLLALDQGTSSSRSIVFDERGHIVAQAQLELPQIYPQPGWVEHDPMEIWRTQLATAREALAKAGIARAPCAPWASPTSAKPRCCGTARDTGQPVHHAIVWQDRRAEPACAQLREQGHADTIQAKTGLLIDAYFSGTKLQWLLDNVPGARDAAERGELAFGTVDSWLMWQLTHGQVHVNRREQRLAHHAVQCAHQPVGRRTAGAAAHPQGAAARGAAVQRPLWRHRRRPAGPRHSHRRCGG